MATMHASMQSIVIAAESFIARMTKSACVRSQRGCVVVNSRSSPLVTCPKNDESLREIVLVYTLLPSCAHINLPHVLSTTIELISILCLTQPESTRLAVP